MLIEPYPEISISIHALRGEGDLNKLLNTVHSVYFNPRPPWGGRRKYYCCPFQNQHFNPRPPWGGRPWGVLFVSPGSYFNPRPPWGGRRKQDADEFYHYYFNPRPPWGGRPI